LKDGEFMANLEAGQVKEKPKRLVSPIIILILGLILLMWLVLLSLNKSLYDNLGLNLSLTWWVYIVSIILIILICILLVAAYPAKTPIPEPTFSSATPILQAAGTQGYGGVIVTSAQPVQASGAMEVVEAEPLIVEAEVVEVEPLEEEEVEPPKDLKMKKPRLIEYPKKVAGGVYGDTIIRVDPRTKLNLRTLLVRSCLICDRQGKCWEEVMDTIPRDKFMENIDCKKGLRKLKGHVGERAGPKKLKRKLVKKAKPSGEF
jgi:hypothetical protein